MSGIQKIKGIFFCCCFIVSFGVMAELKEISDEDLAQVTGQAFISIDRHYHPDPQESTSYTRVNFGMDVELQLNADVLELGRYDRLGEAPGSADVLINNFGLGYIYTEDYFVANPDAPRPIKADGSLYTEGEIVPFKITDPYLEFAYDESSQEVVGMRIGYGEALGVLSGNIESLTGNVNVDIIDRGEGMQAANSNGTLIDQIIVLLTPLLESNSPISTKAVLVDGDDNSANVGSLDPVRAGYIGVPDGEKFVLSGASGFTRWTLKNLLGWGSSSEIVVPDCTFFDCPGGDIEITVQDCKVLGIDSCFSLSQYEAFSVGDITESDGKRWLSSPKKGMFMSFQTKDLDWLSDLTKGTPTVNDFIRTTSGAFFNVPNGAVEVNLQEALYGVPHVRREYIDRGVGLF